MATPAPSLQCAEPKRRAAESSDGRTRGDYQARPTSPTMRSAQIASAAVQASGRAPPSRTAPVTTASRYHIWSTRGKSFPSPATYWTTTRRPRASRPSGVVNDAPVVSFVSILSSVALMNERALSTLSCAVSMRHIELWHSTLVRLDDGGIAVRNREVRTLERSRAQSTSTGSRMNSSEKRTCISDGWRPFDGHRTMEASGMLARRVEIPSEFSRLPCLLATVRKPISVDRCTLRCSGFP